MIFQFSMCRVSRVPTIWRKWIQSISHSMTDWSRSMSHQPTRWKRNTIFQLCIAVKKCLNCRIHRWCCQKIDPCQRIERYHFHSLLTHPRLKLKNPIFSVLTIWLSCSQITKKIQKNGLLIISHQDLIYRKIKQVKWIWMNKYLSSNNTFLHFERVIYRKTSSQL